jgi:hypothetical protein
MLLPLGDIVEDITRSHNGDKGDSFEGLKGTVPSRELWVRLKRRGLQAWRGIRKSVWKVLLTSLHGGNKTPCPVSKRVETRIWWRSQHWLLIESFDHKEKEQHEDVGGEEFTREGDG